MKSNFHNKKFSQTYIFPCIFTVTLDNDIALVEISPPVDLGEDENINPICLPSSEETFYGEQVTATGWGTLSSGKLNKRKRKI